MDAKENREETVRHAKRDLILDAARTVFAEKGFYECRLEDIAEEAGFSKAALYNYYQDKEAIFLNLATRDFERLFETMRQGLDPRASFVENLERQLRTVLTFFGEHFSFVLTSASFQAMGKANLERLADCHEKMFGKFKKQALGFVDLFVEVIKEGKRRGEIRTALDERVLTHYFDALVRGIIFQWRLQGKKGDIDKEIKQIMVFLGNGLNIKAA